MKFLLLILILVVFYFPVSGQDKARYKIRSERCKDNKCFARAYISPKNYDEANLQKVAAELAKKYKDKEIVHLLVFDDEEIIEAYLEGVREPVNTPSDTRAHFVHKAGCGDMLFYKAENDKVKLVKISWKNEVEKCNEPFAVF